MDQTIYSRYLIGSITVLVLAVASFVYLLFFGPPPQIAKEFDVTALKEFPKAFISNFPLFVSDSSARTSIQGDIGGRPFVADNTKSVAAYSWSLLGLTAGNMLERSPESLEAVKLAWAGWNKSNGGDEYINTMYTLSAVVYSSLQLDSAGASSQELATEVFAIVETWAGALISFHQQVERSGEYEKSSPMMLAMIMDSTIAFIRLYQDEAFKQLRGRSWRFSSDRNAADRERVLSELRNALRSQMAHMNDLSVDGQYECFRLSSRYNASVVLGEEGGADMEKINVPFSGFKGLSAYLASNRQFGLLSLQSRLPCLELALQGEMIAPSTDADKFLLDIVGRFFDQGVMRHCFGNFNKGIPLAIALPAKEPDLMTTLKKNGDCESILITVADNAWLSSIVSRWLVSTMAHIPKRAP